MSIRRTIALLLVAAAPAAAQDTCPRDKSFLDCFSTAYSLALHREEKKVLDRKIDAAVQDKVTPEGAPQTASAQRDFLSSFFTSLGLGTTQQNGETLTLMVNPDLLRIGTSHKLAVKVVLRDPEPFSPILETFPEDERASQSTSLGQQLGEFDDAEIALEWNLRTARYGRDVRVHQALVDDFFGDVLNSTLNQASTAGTQALLEALRNPEFQGIDFVATINTLTAVPPDKLKSFEKTVLAAAHNVAARQQLLERVADETRFFLLSDLINNQPQWNASFSVRNRDDIAGPDETSGQISYEHGFTNLNSWRRQKGTLSLSTLRDYAAETEQQRKLSQRVSGSISYAQTSRYDCPLENCNLRLKASEIWSAVFAYSQFLRWDDSGLQTARLDFELQGETRSGDSMRVKDRLTAALTLSQRLTDGTDASLSLVWANRPEFRGEVDEEFGLRAGLKYKVERKQ